MKRCIGLILSLIVVTVFFTPVIHAASVPQPSIPKSDYLVGTFYFPAWRFDYKDQSTDGWLAIENFPERKPLLGYYDEGDPEVTDWEIKWATEHGVNFFIFEWGRCDQTTQNSSCNELLGKPIDPNRVPRHHALDDGFLRASLKDKMKFSLILIDNVPYSQSFSSLDDLRNNLMPFLINNYFKQPNYLVVDNKPVLYLFTSISDLAKMSGGSEENAKQALQIMRQSVQASGFTDLIIAGHDWQYVNRSMYDNGKLKDIGFDYSFSYVVPVVSANGVPLGTAPTEQQAIQSQNESLQFLKNNTALPFIVTASPFWDSYPYSNDRSKQYWYISPEGYKTVLENAKAVMKQGTADLTKRMIILDAWNEYGEGHYIAPDAKNGFGYLNAAWETLTYKNTTPDSRLPAQVGMGPYDSIYQKYVQDHERSYAVASKNIYRFTNVDQFIDIRDLGFTLEAEQTVTFGAWIKADLTDNNYIPLTAPYRLGIILGKNGDGHCVVGTQNNSGYSPGTVAVWSTGKIKPNTWHHIMCIYDGSHVSAYIDGVKTSTSTPTISGTLERRPTRLRLGYSPVNWYPMSISGLTILNKVMSDAEIASQYNSTNPTNDLNYDNVINIYDYNLLITNYGKSGVVGFSTADINNNGNVDIYDYNLFVTQYKNRN